MLSRPALGRPRIAGLALLGSVVMACAGPAPTVAPSPSAGPTPTMAVASPTTAPSADPATSEFDGSVKLADGRDLRVRCIGQGEPTIVLEGGGIDPDLFEWPEPLVNGLGALSRTCAYSRAGGEGSTPAERPRTTSAIVSDLYEMLDQLAAQGVAKAPYVLVGHSLGGTIALAEAMTRPETTAGLVILDTDFPQKSIQAGIDHCVAIGLPRADCEAGAIGDEEAKGIDAAAAALAKPVPDLPIAVVSAGRPDPGCAPVADCQRMIDLLAEAMGRDWRQLGDQVTHTIVDGDHDGMLTTARAQIRDVIQAVLEAARAAS